MNGFLQYFPHVRHHKWHQLAAYLMKHELSLSSKLGAKIVNKDEYVTVQCTENRRGSTVHVLTEPVPLNMCYFNKRHSQDCQIMAA